MSTYQILNFDGIGTATTTSAYNGHPVITFTTEETPAGTGSKLEVKRNEGGEISAKLYIRYIKSKLNNFQLTNMNIRIEKLKALVLSAHEMGQIAMYETYSLMLAIVIRESEAYACGVRSYIDRSVIDKYKSKVKERPIKFDLFQNFPRVVPEDIKTKMKFINAADLFDELWVLYADYTKQDIKTTKEKIREKDPILFGVYSYQPDRFYYICDWVDEYCDLTMEKLIRTIKLDDPTFALTKVPEMNEDMMALIKREVLNRHKRLKETRPGNYKELMIEEEEERKKRLSFNKENSTDGKKVKSKLLSWIPWLK